MATRTFPAPDDLDLRRTVGALGMKASGRARATGEEAWWSTRTPGGPATLQVVRSGRTIEAEAWGEGAGWLLDRAPDIVGSLDAPEAFAPPPGIIRELLRRAKGLRIGRTARVFDALVPTILGQKVTNQEARRSGYRLLRVHGEPAPGPTDAFILPPPAHLASMSYADFHPLGIERKRAEIIIETARRVKRLEAIMEMSRADAMRRLGAIRGIGPWTIGHVMGIAYGDPDAVPVGDFHLPNTVAYALAGEDRGDDERMLELLEPYRGHRRRAVLLLKGAGIKAPKFGPRHAVRSIEHI